MSTASDKIHKQIRDILDQFNISNLPWVIRVYIFFIGAFLILLVVSSICAHHPPDDKDLWVRLFTICSDAFKLVLGAVLGSLSLAAEAIWRKNPESPVAEATDAKPPVTTPDGH
jgi:hypothetical protein